MNMPKMLMPDKTGRMALTQTNIRYRKTSSRIRTRRMLMPEIARRGSFRCVKKARSSTTKMPISIKGLARVLTKLSSMSSPFGSVACFSLSAGGTPGPPPDKFYHNHGRIPNSFPSGQRILFNLGPAVLGLQPGDQHHLLLFLQQLGLEIFPVFLQLRRIG